MKPQFETQKIISYFNSLETRLSYGLFLNGRHHFGYYPKGQENLPIPQAQKLMEDKLAEKLDLPKKSLVLDAGSGQGAVSVYLAQKYDFHIRGIDLIFSRVKIANTRAEKAQLTNVSFQTANYTQLPFPNNYFNGVFTMETLVHAADHQKVLKEFRRVLKPGGKIVLFEYSIAPNKMFSPEQLKIEKMIIEGSGMNSLPSFVHGHFPEILAKAGFKNIIVENITPRILPMLRKLYLVGYLPYQLIKMFGLQRKFINVTAMVEGYQNIKDSDLGRYNIISASLPPPL